MSMGRGGVQTRRGDDLSDKSALKDALLFSLPASWRKIRGENEGQKEKWGEGTGWVSEKKGEKEQQQCGTQEEKEKWFCQITEFVK